MYVRRAGRVRSAVTIDEKPLAAKESETVAHLPRAHADENVEIIGFQIF